MLLIRNKLELDRRRAARESPVIKSEGAALSRRCAAIERRPAGTKRDFLETAVSMHERHHKL